MLVRDLITCMHPTEVVKVCVWENRERHNTLFECKSLGNVGDLKIPEDVLAKEVNYYTMFYNIVTHKGKEENYETLPYIELEITFNIAVY